MFYKYSRSQPNDSRIYVVKMNVDRVLVLMSNLRLKIEYIIFYMSGLNYIFFTPSIADFPKRIILRRFFILLDSLIALLSHYNNILYKNNLVLKEEMKSQRNLINSLYNDWKQFDRIRDKLCAHFQELSPLDYIYFWNSIDYTLTNTYYEQILKITNFYRNKGLLCLHLPPDYEELILPKNCLLNNDNYRLSYSRIFPAIKNTVGIIPINDFQTLCSSIISVIEFLTICFSFTQVFNNPQTYWRHTVFNSAWSLIACDSMTLIDLMYNDSQFNKSILSLSFQGWKGIDAIKLGNQERDRDFENELKLFRNKYGAHIDRIESISSLHHLYDVFDIEKLHKYIVFHVNIFIKACASDFRTRIFSGPIFTYLPDITEISYSAAKDILN